MHSVGSSTSGNRRHTSRSRPRADRSLGWVLHTGRTLAPSTKPHTTSRVCTASVLTVWCPLTHTCPLVHTRPHPLSCFCRAACLRRQDDEFGAGLHREAPSQGAYGLPRHLHYGSRPGHAATIRWTRLYREYMDRGRKKSPIDQ